jgi:hypothetical protein
LEASGVVRVLIDEIGILLHRVSPVEVIPGHNVVELVPDQVHDAGELG